MNFRYGQRFQNTIREEFILSQTGYSIISLISLKTGNRVNNGVKVINPISITTDEFLQIIGDNTYTLISKLI